MFLIFMLFFFFKYSFKPLNTELFFLSFSVKTNINYECTLYKENYILYLTPVIANKYKSMSLLTSH